MENEIMNQNYTNLVFQIGSALEEGRKKAVQNVRHCLTN